LALASISAWRTLHGVECGCFPGIQLPTGVSFVLDAILACLLYLDRNPPKPAKQIPVMLTSGFALIICSLGTLALLARTDSSPWTAHVPPGRWKMIALRSGCDHCRTALRGLIPILEAPNEHLGIVSLGESDWMYAMGLPHGILVVSIPDDLSQAPLGYLVDERNIVSTFPISEAEE
jgi:hypothetical protein